MQPPINKDQSPEKVAARMRGVFEMYEEGLLMLKARLRRQYPHESASQIQERVARFLRDDHEESDDYIRPSSCPRFLQRS